jgi:hypothetical protein
MTTCSDISADVAQWRSRYFVTICPAQNRPIPCVKQLLFRAWSVVGQYCNGVYGRTSSQIPLNDVVVNQGLNAWGHVGIKYGVPYLCAIKLCGFKLDTREVRPAEIRLAQDSA